MAEDNLELAVRKVTLGENKVCGLTHPDDAAKAYQAGAVFGGLIFVEKSKRAVDFESARLTMSGAPLNYVGVFQNHDADYVASIVTSLGLKAVQLHGQEDQEYVNQLKTELPVGVEIWKATAWRIQSHPCSQTTLTVTYWMLKLVLKLAAQATCSTGL